MPYGVSEKYATPQNFDSGVFFCKNCGTINKEDFTYKILLSSDYQEGDWNEQKFDNFKTR